MMDSSQFKTGDVFLFEHDNSFILRLISRLSHSPVSHVAMYYEEGLIIEEGRSGISTRPISELSGRPIAVHRHDQSNKSSGPLLKVARQHLEISDPHPTDNLLAVGVLLVFNQWKPATRPTVRLLLEMVSSGLAEAAAKLIHLSKHSGICSQFVYEMYAEAKFKLHILDKENNLRAAHPSSSLISLAMKLAEFGQAPVVDLTSPGRPDSKKIFKMEDFEKNCGQLLDILGQTDQGAAPTDDSESLDSDLYKAILEFASILQEADGAINPVLVNPHGLQDWAIITLQHLQKHYSAFVLPSLLFRACPALKQEIAVLNQHK